MCLAHTLLILVETADHLKLDLANHSPAQLSTYHCGYIKVEVPKYSWRACTEFWLGTVNCVAYPHLLEAVYMGW